MDSSEASKLTGRLVENVETVIQGKRHSVEQAILALLSGGNLLIEDVPGTGKTMLARSIARSIDGTFKRIQFTPDLLPSDITGISIYNQKTGEFEFTPGPVFSNIVLADEINRTTPRTQASLLEAMEEHQVTVDGITHPLPEPFFVIATQNPMEYHGTYPLPEGQLDRFLMSIELGYPGAATEQEIVRRQQLEHPIHSVASVLEAAQLLEIQRLVREVVVDDALVEYALAIVTRTRSHPDLMAGASPRGTLSLTRVAQASALHQGRDYCIPDDIKRVAISVLSHRLVLKPQLRVGRFPAKRVVATILDEVPVPVGR